MLRGSHIEVNTSGRPGALTPQAGKGSATLSMAYAAAAFANSCLRAMGGEDDIVDCACALHPAS